MSSADNLLHPRYNVLLTKIKFLFITILDSINYNSHNFHQKKWKFKNNELEKHAGTRELNFLVRGKVQLMFMSTFYNIHFPS